jgi:hypothetical protein
MGWSNPRGWSYTTDYTVFVNGFMIKGPKKPETPTVRLPAKGCDFLNVNVPNNQGH